MSSKATRTMAAVLLLAVVASTLLLLAPQPASTARVHRPGHNNRPRCDPRRDVVVKQTAGAPQLDGTKAFDVTVTNQGRDAVHDVRLYCGYRFRPARAVDPDLLIQARPSDGCLLIDGGAIAAGGRASFSYAGYVRYTMDVVSVTCAHHP